MWTDMGIGKLKIFTIKNGKVCNNKIKIIKYCTQVRSVFVLWQKLPYKI